MTAAARAPKVDVAPNAARLAHPVVNADTVYPNTLVGLQLSSGMLTPWASTAGLVFRGLAIDGQTTSKEVAGDGTQVPANLFRVDESGLILRGVTVAGSSAQTQAGQLVFATTDNPLDDLTLVPDVTVGPVARVIRWLSGTTCDVQLLTPEQAAQLARVNTMEFTFDLADLANGDLLTNIPVPGHGYFIGLEALVTRAATTPAKAAQLNLEIGTTNLTGGVLSLTSANMTPLGARVAATAITAASYFKPGDTFSLEAASVTAFVEGRITVRILWRSA